MRQHTMPALIERGGPTSQSLAVRAKQYRSRRVSFEEKPLGSLARCMPLSAGRLFGLVRALATVMVILALPGGILLPAHAQPERPRLVATYYASKDKGIGPLRFSSDGRTLAMAAGDGVVLWEVAARQVRARLEAPSL